VRLFLIRHGEVIPPAPGAFYGGTEVDLSDRGRREARAAARLIADEPVTAVYSSPLSRARYGAEQVLAGRRAVPLEIVPELREIDRGRWTGHTPEQVETRWPGDLDRHRLDLETWRGHGGESLGDLRDRCLKVQDRLAQRHEGETVVVVSHLFPTRAMLAAAAGLPLERWSSLRLPTGSVSRIDAVEGTAQVLWTGRRGGEDEA